MKLEALQTFSSGGSALVRQGETFDTSESRADEYIRLGLAKKVGDQDPVKPIVDSPPLDIPRTDYTESELMDMTLTKLKAIAKEQGITGYSTMSKSELAFAILAKQRVNNA